jgi:hypothetical protein
MPRLASGDRGWSRGDPLNYLGIFSEIVETVFGVGQVLSWVAGQRTETNSRTSTFVVATVATGRDMLPNTAIED